jgi:hypothetical protein
MRYRDSGYTSRLRDSYCAQAGEAHLVQQLRHLRQG